MHRDELLFQIADDFSTSEFAEIIGIYNDSRSLTHARDQYTPAAKVDAQVHFIQALDNTIRVDAFLWQEYCSKPIELIEVPGDHYSIFREPEMQQLARCFNELLKSTFN